MYRTLQQRLTTHLRTLLAEHYSLDLPYIPLEQPPTIALGELATPIAFDLAKRLRKAPRVIAAELLNHLQTAIADGHLEGIAAVDLAGAGYLNLRFDRAATVRDIAANHHADLGGPGFRLVEHTSINPNKAAHIGHLRNAILGDTFARLLHPDDFKSGWQVGVQNYIDNTGVQVADVVVGLTHLLGLDLTGVRERMTELLESNQRIDYFCWDLYARVSRWYTADPEQAAARKSIRLQTLHALETGVDEQGSSDTATIADEIATAVLKRHLETMLRLGIEYDFLPRESEILTLHFWDAARQLMLDKGVLYLETQGKNAGCYVMRRAGTAAALTPAVEPGVDHIADPGPAGLDAASPDPDAKVIVRSNGTVTYVGKDIAYHLWKFNLLPGKDFGYQPFFTYPSHTCWISAPTSGPNPPPSFGHADAIVNVIDSRQNDPQNNVIEALRGMGFTDAANHYTHFSYEMVALTPRCALDLGYPVSEEDQKRPYLEVSGRKGFGVKADDLIDRLIAAALTEVSQRHPELSSADQADIARQIAVGALRFFMLRFTRNTVIAFDFKDALSFEGETGPYIQYAIVRAANILRKASTTGPAALAVITSTASIGIPAENFSPASAVPFHSTDQAASDGPPAVTPDPTPTLDPATLATLLTGPENTSIWETWLLISRLSTVLDQAITTAEPAHLARYAFQLAQQFNNFYHRHHVLNETDPTRRTLLLATAAASARELTRTLALLGIEAPPVM